LPVIVNELLPLAADIEKLFMERENDGAGCTTVTCFVVVPDVTKVPFSSGGYYPKMSIRTIM
jgi:hypothetical protein